MAKKGMSTCKGCDVKFPTEELQVYSGKKYCSNCYDVKMQDKQNYDNLITYILYCFNIDKPTGLILKQIKEYKEKFNYSASGIHYTLWYCNEIKKIKFESKFGIAIVKYEYENAEKYFFQQNKIRNSVSENKNKIRKIIIKDQVIENKNKLLVDINELIKGGV